MIYAYIRLQHLLLQGIFSNEVDGIILDLIKTDFPKKKHSNIYQINKKLPLFKGICRISIIIRNFIKRSLTKSFKELSKIVIL